MDAYSWVGIKRISASEFIVNPESALSFIAKLDSQYRGWKINCTRIHMISSMIFPHEIEINSDTMSILLRLDVIS